jgi:RNA polymerase sigma factor (sigma-70 family)
VGAEVPGMPSRSLSVLVQRFRSAAGRDGDGRTDGELLTRFLSRRDEDALAALVGRHAPMVWGVCCRLLRHPHDAEDAFQATFLVLVRKAATVVPRERLANWLYGVAQQTAVRLRATAAKRGWREVQMVEMPEPAAAEARDEELLSRLDEELSRLPERFRALIVLCDLEGHTRKEVARQLDCPEGTVASGLARARELLAKRLTRRGLAVSGGALAAALSHSAASADVPATVVTSAIHVATLFAAGQASGVISGPVATLTQGVIKTMFLKKILTTAVVLAVGVAVLTGGSLAVGQTEGKPTVGTDTKPVVAEKPVEPAAKREKGAFTAWGKEVDGLQMGLVLVPADAHSVRQSETAKFAVKLRNVGSGEATVTHGVLREHAPQVTTDAGGRVSVYTPPPFDNFAVPRKRVIQPGETITLYSPEVAVESEDRAKLDGEMRVDAPTICVGPGKYKISYSGMIQSHPQLATRTVDFEVKDQVAWGQEAGGLQAGIVAPRTVRIGEKAKFVVKVRNVGKETIKVSAWPLWMNHPGVVDPRGDRVRTTVAPTPLFEVSPKALTLKPGETVDVGRSDLIVAEPDQKVTVPDGVVDLCAIHVKPGTHKAACVGFLKENHLLATGAVEFEVKAAKEGVTAWGQELGGLQAGLTIADKRAYRHGETVTLVVRVRNVGKEAVKFNYIKQYLDEKPPGVTGADGKVIPQATTGVMGLIHAPVEVSLEPGKEVMLGTRIHGTAGVPYELCPVGGGGEAATKNHPLRVGTGKVTLGYEKVFGSSSIGRLQVDPALAGLATGKLELEVSDKPPVAEEKPRAVPAKPKPEAKKVYTPDELMREKYDAAATRTVEFKVVTLAKPTEVRQSPDKDAPWVIGHSPEDLSLLPQPPKKFHEEQFSATLTSKVVDQLRRIGVKDVGKHFDGKTIRITGRIRQHNYSGDDPPVGPHYHLVIEDVSQIEAVE